MLRKTNRIRAALFGAIGLTTLALAQSPGTFTPAGNLSIPRELHTATLLPNGKVLIAGGFSFGNGPTQTWASAEIYDPSKGTFTATGDMSTARQGHTATLLPNGKVLIAGGASAELYDPATETFSATGSMTTPRGLHTATLLNNGKVLIAGGNGFAGGGQAVELYDPSTGTFAATGDMTEPGIVDTATLLPNGKVLITRSVQYFREDHADLYDPATGTFTRTGDLIDHSTAGKYTPGVPGQEPTATLLTNGKVLIAGGSWGDFGGSTIAEIYDPATGTFSATGEMTAGIDAWSAAKLLPDGRVLIAGEGNNGVECPLTHIGPPITVTCPGAAELYDPASGTFSRPAVSQSMEGHAATLLPDGTVLLSGGFRCCGLTIATAEIYDPGVLVPAPQLFSVSGDGRGQGTIWHAATGEIASSGSPAVAGEALSMYTTNLADGGAIPPQVTIGGRLAEVTYFGAAPGYPGYNQVNVRVPGGLAPGPTVPVRLNYLGRPSNEVTVSVQ
jgi:galactose oxidase-like protein